MPRVAVKRPRRTFTVAYKRETVARFEQSEQPRAVFARSIGVDDKLLFDWVRLYGSGAQRGGWTRARALAAPKEALREPGDHPHATRIATFLARKPHSLFGADYEDLCLNVSEAVSAALDETNVDGSELVAELAN